MNFGELKQSISTRLNRPDLLLPISPSTQAIIPTMISDRIRYYQRALYSPSETLDYSVTCVPGQSIYALNAYPALVALQCVLNVRLLLNSIWIPLRRVDYYTDLLASDVLQPAFQSLPSYWATYGQTLRLFPNPGAPYPLELMCNAAVPEPSDDTKINWWTLDAATLLIESVCADICRLVLNDDARATQHQWAAEREHDSLRAYTFRLRGPARVKGHF